MQSPNYTRSYAYHIKQYPGNSQLNPPFQQPAATLPQETTKRLQESIHNDHQMIQPSQVDRILDTLQQETSKHNETRMMLQVSRQKIIQLERLLYYERSLNHTLRVNAQEAEIRRIASENKARAFEQHESSLSTPLSDYKSATFSPSINLTFPSMGTMSEMSMTPGIKRQAQLTLNSNCKRSRSWISPVSPRALEVEGAFEEAV